MKEMSFIVVIVGLIISMFISFGIVFPYLDTITILSDFETPIKFFIGLLPMILWMLFTIIWDLCVEKYDYKKRVQ